MKHALCSQQSPAPTGESNAVTFSSPRQFMRKSNVDSFRASNGALFWQQPSGNQFGTLIRITCTCVPLLGIEWTIPATATWQSPCRGSFLRHSRLIENHIKRWRSTAMRRAWHVIHKHRAKARGTADAVNSYLWATLQPAHRRALRSFEFNCDICIRASPLDPASENDDAINSNIPRHGI